MRKMVLLSVTAFIAIGLGVLADNRNDDADTALSINRLSTAYGPQTFDAALVEANREVTARGELAKTSRGSWLADEILAIALMERFDLTGDHADLEKARALLDSGLQRAPNPSGPTLTRAALALDLHQLDDAAARLDRFDRAVAPYPQETAQALSMRGDIAFQTGKLAEAGEFYDEATRLDPGLGSKLRRANFVLWSGKAAEARIIAETALAETKTRPQPFARSALLMANFSYAQGDLERAGEWIEAANLAFADFWLGEAYAAQHLAVTSDMDGGIARLEALAKKKQEPEIINVLVGLLIHEGRDREAATWNKRAIRLWDRKLASTPDAYRLHAAEHYLDFGNPKRAVTLARDEVAKRPQGDSIEVLASALIAAGKPAEGLRWLKKAEQSGYRAVSLYLAQSDAFDALGQDKKAEASRDKALAINPMATDPRRKLIRLGHY